VRGAGPRRLTRVEPFHVPAFIKELQEKRFAPRKKQFSPPTVKQHLVALRMLFDCLMIEHVIDVNLAHAVRGPK
jgi:site-specific recombinase XerD